MISYGASKLIGSLSSNESKLRASQARLPPTAESAPRRRRLHWQRSQREQSVNRRKSRKH